MSNVKKRLDKGALPGQMSLFEVIRQVTDQQRRIDGATAMPGTANLDTVLKELISESLKRTRLSRYQVAGEMSRLLGREITKAQIDSWSAESKEGHGMKVCTLNAFMAATGDVSILRLLCEKAGGFFVEGIDALYTELGRIDDMKKELADKERLIKQTLERLKR